MRRQGKGLAPCSRILQQKILHIVIVIWEVVVIKLEATRQHSLYISGRLYFNWVCGEWNVWKSTKMWITLRTSLYKLYRTWINVVNNSPPLDILWIHAGKLLLLSLYLLCHLKNSMELIGNFLFEGTWARHEALNPVNWLDCSPTKLYRDLKSLLCIKTAWCHVKTVAGNLDWKFKHFNTLSLPLNLFLTRSTFLSDSICFPPCVSFTVSLSDTHRQTKHTQSLVKHLSRSYTSFPSIWSIEKTIHNIQTLGGLERRRHMLLLRPFVLTVTTVDSMWRQPLFNTSLLVIHRQLSLDTASVIFPLRPVACLLQRFYWLVKCIYQS